MKQQIATAIVTGPKGSSVQQVLVVSFEPAPNPIAPVDQAMELRIQAQGQLLHADLVDFARTKDPAFYESAERNRKVMYALINARSPERKAQMAQERGLPHA